MKPSPALLALLTLAACEAVTTPDEDAGENEVITTVRLTFAPASGDALVFTWDDPENDGSPSVDEVRLPVDATYALSIAFLDRLSEPDADLTGEIAEEGDEHQVFVTGSAVVGPAGAGAAGLLSHAYADLDDDGAPIGLEADVTALATGTGELTVTLQHLPAQSGAAIKTATLADTVADAGLAALPGSTDAQVTFPVVVEE